jgi:hypothetical protein
MWRTEQQEKTKTGAGGTGENGAMKERDNDEYSVQGGYSIINLPGDHVARGCYDHYEDGEARLLKWLYYYAIGNRWSWKTFTEEVGLRAEEIGNVLTGKPNTDGHLTTVIKYAKELREKVGSEVPHYAKTSFAKEIVGALNTAREALEAGDWGIVFVAGESGCGKTCVGRGWNVENNHGVSQFYEFDNGGGKKHVIQQLAGLNNINRWLSYTDTVERLQDCFRYSPRVLIIDEPHLMLEGRIRHLDTIEYLRRLADITHSVIVFLATMDRFQAALAETAYNDVQFWRRCLQKLLLNRHGTAKDIETVFAFRCPGLTLDEKLLDVLTLINEHEKGGFGMVNTVISNAHRFARRTKEKLTRTHLLVAAKDEVDSLDAIQKAMGSSVGRSLPRRRR